MDWLRRNWPDLLIGLALIAVIAGIVATLLTGGSFFPLGGSTVQPQPAEPSVSAPPAPDVGPSGVGDESTPGSDGPEVAVLPPSGSSDDTTPPGAPSTDVGAESAGQAAASETAPSEEAGSEVTPLAPDQAAPESESADADASASAADAAASDAAASDAAASDAAASDGAASEAAAAPQDPQSTPQAAGAATASLPTEPYRVAVGAFGQRANAEAQADRFRAAGYPVFLASQDALTLVLVGPYDEEAEAQRVAAEIRSGEYDVDPVIYLFEQDDAGSVGVSGGVSGGASAGASTGASTAPAAEGEGTRLQVGAYADPAAAQPQIDRLEALGFDVRSIDENGLVKLVVGPFSGSALDDASVILDGAGIEYFSR